MGRRRFSRGERLAVELVSGKTGDQADHIVPVKCGGKTVVENCQLIGAAMNRRKGAFHFKLWQWQEDFLEKWESRKPGSPFMLTAIPGGGKTKASLEVCRRWLSAGPDRRVVVVVPTDPLREQWKDEASLFGMSLQTKEFGTDFKDGFIGGVATYHLIAKSPLIFRALCAVNPVLVVFDEIHHCGDEADFGKGIKTAFELSRERLLLSGTPWKTDGSPIPFVRYDGDGFAVPDFAYDYPQALNDNVVRYLVFDHAKGVIHNRLSGQDEEVSSIITEADAKRRLSRLLNPNGKYVEEQIATSHAKLVECRQIVPDAGALAACIDQQHALEVAKVVRRVTHTEPSIIVSDSDIENDTVKDFRRSKTMWLVAVRKVTEGTDIKRLQVLSWLTNVTSPLFFRQLVGRVSRHRGLEDFEEAYVYLPADPRLIECAKTIEMAQVQALKQQNEQEIQDLKDRSKEDGEVALYTTEHAGTDIILVGNKEVTVEDAKQLEMIAAATKTSMQKVLQIREMLGSSVSVDVTEKREVSKEDRMDELRRDCNRVAFRLAKLSGVPVKDVHFEWPKQKFMTERQLEDKLAALLKRCSEY